MRAVLIAGVAALLVAGCGIGDQAAYDQRGGPAIANQIRLAVSPIVKGVWYRPGDFMDAAIIDIMLKAGVEDDEARAFICAVVLPALAAGDPPESLGVDVLDDASELLYSVDPADSSLSKGGTRGPETCDP